MKQILFPLLAVAVMASCTQSEISDSRPDGEVAIELCSSALSLDISTRSPFEGDISGTNKLSARVLASTTQGDYSSADIINGVLEFSDSKTPVAFSPTKYYPFNDRMYFCGLYPSTAWTSIGTTASFTFDGKDDVMAAAEVNSTKSEAQAATPVLAFRHLLTLLTVKVKASDADAATAWGNLKEITLAKVGNGAPFTTVAVDLATGSAAADASPAVFTGEDANFGFYTTGSDTKFANQNQALTTASVETAYTIAAPVIADKDFNEFTLSVKMEKGGTETVIEVPVNLKGKGVSSDYTGTTQGKKFTISLTFGQEDINAKASVEVWSDAGQSDVEI